MIDTRCGLCCERCSYRDTHHCKGCIATQGHPFHGECPVAVCCQEKGLVHCGQCPEIPCVLLADYSCCDPVHGDKPHGLRIRRCLQWKSEEKAGM